MIETSSVELKNGTIIETYSLIKKSGARMNVLNYGGIVSGLFIPDKHGKCHNICLGFDDDKKYLEEHPCFGALIGRFGNRIAKGKFEIDGTVYQLPINNGDNTLHGGLKGFDKVFWNIEVDGEDLILSHSSPDGAEGFPGKLEVQARYQFSEDHVWSIEYQASSDKATPVNLTQHAYFNLAGAGRGDVLDHEFKFFNEAYTPVDQHLIPTGDIVKASGTEFDFSESQTLRKRYNRGIEYDHNLVLPQSNKSLQLAAIVKENNSGRKMEMWTTEPAFQFYTANFLDGSFHNSVGAFEKWGGFCLEAQNFPDAVNHRNFPNSILKPGAIYNQLTEYRFSLDQ